MKVGRLRDAAHALGFTPADQVRWLSPSQLVRTAGKVVVSSLFADYADRREVQAALEADTIDLSDRPAERTRHLTTDQGAAGPPATGQRAGLWIDFVADLGDGFDSTYTVAWLLGRPELLVNGQVLPRGDVLVMGGDEVYPTPSAAGYEDRTTGPYRCALPADAVDLPPVLLAVPGNHDWYDGLTAFLRIFTQQRAIGGWQPRQTRSYFATKLPYGWWLVGLDTQLGTYIDAPQMEYFRKHLAGRLEPGDAVIVCAPAPAWVRTGLGDPDAFNSLHYFEREVVEQAGATVRIWISGDLHHYSRYEEVAADGAAPESPRQLLTSGMGGSYLLGTADLPPTIQVPPDTSRMSRKGHPAHFRRAAAWPTAEASRRLALRAFAPTRNGIAGRNPGLWRLLGMVQAFALLLLALLLGVTTHRGPAEALRTATFADVLGLARLVGAWTVGVAAVAWLALPVARLRTPHRPPGWTSVAALQLVLALGTLAAAVAVPWPTWPGWAVLGLAAFGTLVVTGLLACYAVGLYLAFSTDRTVRDWLFSARSIEDGKGFLRLHLDPQGRLTIYPVLVERVCRDWDLEPTAPVAEGRQLRLRPVPAKGAEPEPRLIEPPVSVARSASTAGSGQVHVPALDNESHATEG